MSRNRNSLRTCPYTNSWNYYLLDKPLRGLSDDSNYRYRLGRPYESSITDDPALPTKYSFKPCSHTKVLSSTIDGEQQVCDFRSPTEQHLVGIHSLHAAVGPQRPTIPTFSVPWSSMVSELSDQVDHRLEGKSQLVVSLLELGSTVRMVRNPFSLLSPKFYRKIRKTPKELAKVLPNFWLEYNYGWKSLYTDVVSSCDAITSVEESLLSLDCIPGDPYHRYAIRHNDEIIGPSPTMSDGSWYSMADQTPCANHSPIHRIVYDKWKMIACVGCRAVIDANLVYSRFDKLRQTFGVAWREVPTILWEIVPFSFVVDWFINTDVILRYPQYKASRDRLLRDDIRSLGYSLKTVLPYRLQFAPGNYFTWGSPFMNRYIDGRPRWFFGTEGSYQKYERFNGLPSGTDLTLNGKLSVTQMASGISLLIQRART